MLEDHRNEQVMGAPGGQRGSTASPAGEADPNIRHSGADKHLGPADYRALYDHSPDGVMFTAPDGRVLAANPAACRILGRTEDEICRLGRPGMADHTDPRWEAMLAERAQTGGTRGVARMRRGDGATIEVEMSSRVFTDTDDHERTCTVIRDVTERVEMERQVVELNERLHTLALTDELTGLHNRRGFVAVSRQVLEIAAREGLRVVAMFVDIDHLKLLNDQHGHDTGDQAIRVVAGVLRDELRSADTIARIGGDEFVALILGVEDVDLSLLEQRIRRSVRGVKTVARDRLEVSIGWSLHQPGTAPTIERLLADSDRAMYRDKASRSESC